MSNTKITKKTANEETLLENLRKKREIMKKNIKVNKI